MAKRDEMREALDQLRMLRGEGMFENKEWGGKKVAPDQQQQDPRMKALADLSKKLHEKDQRLIEKEKGLQEREELSESWNGNTQDALKNMHCIQEDDWEKVDEKMKATDRTP